MEIHEVGAKLDVLSDTVTKFTIKASELLATHTEQIKNNTGDINGLGKKLSSVFTSTRLLMLFGFSVILIAIAVAKLVA